MFGCIKHKLESRFPGRSINNLRYTDHSTHMEEREEKLQRLFMFGTEMQESWPDWMNEYIWIKYEYKWIKYIYTFLFSPQTFVSTF